MDRPFDLNELFAALDAVDYTIIGGVAVQVHGHGRTTLDLDVIPSPEPDNLARLAAALVSLDARPLGTPGGGPPSQEQLAVAAIVPPLATRHGTLHIHNEVPGAPPYATLNRRALKLELDGRRLAFASLDDLIAMKRATARPQDLEDLAALTGDD